MQSLEQFTKSETQIQYVFCDIDDTITEHGKLPANSYKALWDLKEKGIHVIPVTGRPAGWCEMIARFWPVSGVIGENGALYYRYVGGKMKRHYMLKEKDIQKNRKKLDKLSKEILKKVKGSAISSDQFCRIFDLAVDFCEDVKPLPKKKVDQIVEIFEKHKAQAKVSSIHVNGWFGKYDKLSMCKVFMKKEFKFDILKQNKLCAFIGDSPNDEPMFHFFVNSFAVHNITNFLDSLKHKPAFVTPSNGASGFVEFAEKILS
ncbi:MAG: HAD-IIB family hydrolase [Bdellovibrionota bacterium]